MNMNKGLAAGLAMAAMMGTTIGVRPPDEAARSWRERAKRLLITNSAHTPKPEEMFAPMLKDYSARLVRRRGKPPLLVRNRAQFKRGQHAPGEFI